MVKLVMAKAGFLVPISCNFFKGPWVLGDIPMARAVSSQVTFFFCEVGPNRDPRTQARWPIALSSHLNS